MLKIYLLDLTKKHNVVDIKGGQFENFSINKKSYNMLSLLSKDFARNIIAGEFNLSPENVVLSVDKFGKPFVENLNIYFNISHSGDKIALAISDSEVGIDVEKYRNVRIKLAEKICTKNEIISIMSAKNPLDELFRYWTLKESYLKAIGTGFNGNPKEIEFLLKNKEIICLNKDYQFIQFVIEDHYYVAVCKKYN